MLKSMFRKEFASVRKYFKIEDIERVKFQLDHFNEVKFSTFVGNELVANKIHVSIKAIADMKFQYEIVCTSENGRKFQMYASDLEIALKILSEKVFNTNTSIEYSCDNKTGEDANTVARWWFSSSVNSMNG